MSESFELIERESSSMLDLAREITVASDEEYANAGEFVMGAKALAAKITAEHEGSIKAAHESHKAAIALRDKHLGPVNQALKIVSEVALSYKREQDRLAREEAERVDRERRRQEEERRLEEAARLDAEGKFEEAIELLDEPILTPRMTKFITPVPKVAGLSTKKKWKGRIIGSHYVTRPYCMPDQGLVNNAVARFFAYNLNPTEAQLSDLILELGGPKAVEIYEEEIFAGRRA